MMLEKLVMQYSTNTTNPAVSSGLRLRGNKIPTIRPIAAKNSVTRVRDRAIRKNSPYGVPERNIAMAKKEASRYAAPTTTTPINTVNAFAQ